MHKYPKKQNSVGSSGQTITTNVSMTPCDWQICHQTLTYVAALHLSRIKLGTKSIRCPYACCGLDKGVAYTRGGVGGTPGTLRIKVRSCPVLR